MKRIGVDVGGTFTDLIYFDDDRNIIEVMKLPTTPADPAIGTVRGIDALCERAGVPLSAIDYVFHGTTIATNIILEHNGAEAGLLITEGFRDLLHIARHKRPYTFSNYQDIPWQRYPLVKRRYTRPIPERVSANGDVLRKLDEDAVRDQVSILRDAGIKSIAVCLLFSFINPDHEQRVEEIVKEMIPDATVSLSSRILPIYREYERFSTIALNAYVAPRVNSYIRNLSTQLQSRGLRSPLHLMTSSGGVVTAEGAVEAPVNLLMSGPVAGLRGGQWAASRSGYSNAITLDVGGTSADIGVTLGGDLQMKHLLDTYAGDYQAMIPMVDINTIGAGGGSIASIDSGNMYQVGPESAGADPGPASYGRGGTSPTLTDAFVNLGWLGEGGLLDGDMKLDNSAANRAFTGKIARRLNLSLVEASYGAVQIAAHSMLRAVEEHSVQRGYDPRDFVLVASGGAGPLFGALLADELGLKGVVVPEYPGLSSAMGLLVSNVSYEYGATVYGTTTTIDRQSLIDGYERLENEARGQLHGDGLPDDTLSFERFADCRYLGQGYELRVAAPAGKIDETWMLSLVEAFHQRHESEFHVRYEDLEVQIINIRVAGVGHIKPVKGHADYDTPQLAPPKPEPFTVREAYFADEAGTPILHKTAYFRRRDLGVGAQIYGPAIVTQYDTTTVIPPTYLGSVDQSRNLVISRTD